MGELVALPVGGVSNSRPTDKSVVTLGEVGLDTVRLRFREAESAQERLRAVGVVTQQARGELRRSKDGVTVGSFPDGMVYVEGRVANLVGREDAGLQASGTLVEAEGLWRDTLGLSGECEVGRADVTGELRFADARDGHDLLAALRSIDHPWLKVGTEGFKYGEVETVYGRYAQGRSVQLRVYDKALESGDGQPGTRIRFERQRRFRKDRARATAEFVSVPLAEWFVGRELRTLAEREREDVVVCNEVGALRELRRLAHEGTIGWQKCERLVGFVWLRGIGQHERTRQRREAELRALGITVDRTVHEVIRVPLGGYLRGLVDALAA
jgi:hypothetical protein